MNSLIAVFLSLVCVFSLSSSWATVLIEKKPMVVKVGVVHFPPYIDIEASGKVGGMIAEILDFMNSSQNNYKFEPVVTSAMRRHPDFKNGAYDISFFDNIDWGWDKSMVDVSDVFMKGKEIYIAKKKLGRGEEYFADFSGKSMVGMLGYHYGFANFNADPTFLRKKYNMQSSTSNEGSIKMILHDRGDIAIVSDAFLNWYLFNHPEDRVNILISNKVDQFYLHTVIVRKNIRPTIQEINGLLTKFRHSKKFKSMEVRYGVTP